MTNERLPHEHPANDLVTNDFVRTSRFLPRKPAGPRSGPRDRSPSRRGRRRRALPGRTTKPVAGLLAAALLGLPPLLLLAAAAPAAGQGFRFRAEATRVLVDVLVLDGDGNPVPGLGPADFELFEDGTEQQVASVEVVDWERYSVADPKIPPEIPPEIPAAPEAPAAADPPPPANATPRRFVIVFNRRLADPVNLRRAKRGLEEFVTGHMVDGDETMILDFANTVRVLQEFSPGKQETLAAVRRIVPGTYESPVGPEMDARDSFQMLYALSEALEPVEGRKIVVLFSIGLDTFADPRARIDTTAGEAVEEFPGRRQLDEANSLFAAIRQLNHANATLYTVDLEGIYGNENRILTASLNEFDVLGNERELVPSAPLDRMEMAANLPSEGGAASLAIATGGEYYPNTTNFAVPLSRIGRQNELYYLLSFSPENTELDGSYRRLEVRVRGRDDLRVVARPGYFARERRRGAGSPVAGTVARGDYDYALPENLHTYAYLLNAVPGGAFAALRAALPASSLPEPDADAVAELGFRVLDAGGGTLAEAGDRVDRQRFWVSAAAPLPAGEHRFEILVGSGDRLRSVSTTLTVPADYGSTFSLSSVFPFVAEAEGQGPGPPVRPVASFAVGEEARVAFFVFPGHEAPVTRVSVAYEIENERGDISVRTEQPRLFDLDPARADGIPIMLPLGTGGLPVGRYTAVVRVTESGGSRTAASELDFEIR